MNFKIERAEAVYAPQKIEQLDEKRLVPQMMLRRRLTRAAKIMIYLADRCGYDQGPVVYGSAYGELQATADIVGAIAANESISPTAFQNSVYNTAASYFSLLHGNKGEILTLSGGDGTSADVIKTAALQAVFMRQKVLMVCTETLDIPGIEEVNRCAEYLEAGVACTLVPTDAEADTVVEAKKHPGFAPSLWAMLDLAALCEGGKTPIISVTL